VTCHVMNYAVIIHDYMSGRSSVQPSDSIESEKCLIERS